MAATSLSASATLRLAVAARGGAVRQPVRAVVPSACAGAVQQAHSVAGVPGARLSARGAARQPLSAVAATSRRRAARSWVVSASADAAAEAPAPDQKKTDAKNKAVLIALFALWYASNIFFNIWNKQLLKLYPFPITGTFLQLGLGSVLAILMWTFRLKAAPQLNAEMMKSLFPLACIHTLGNVLTNVSLTKVSVAFTHTVKAMEPFFSVMLSWLFLGMQPHPLVVASLVPIVGGVAMASFTEPSFSWAGFLSALGSNITFQSRNVLSKKMMLKNIKQGTMDNINIFSVITIMAFFICMPVVLLIEGVHFTPGAIAEYTGSADKAQAVMNLMFLGGLCFHTYQQVSYLILQRVETVTHAVGNCVKRVVVIVSSIIFFQTPVSPINGAGTALALAGVFGYSKAKQVTSKGKGGGGGGD